jgi:hypothetical protein
MLILFLCSKTALELGIYPDYDFNANDGSMPRTEILCFACALHGLTSQLGEQKTEISYSPQSSAEDLGAIGKFE